MLLASRFDETGDIRLQNARGDRRELERADAAKNLTSVVPRQPHRGQFPGKGAVVDFVRARNVEAAIRDPHAALRVLETSHPPTWYLPRAAFASGALEPAAGSSFCEWKGCANYLDVVGGDARAASAAWTYPKPSRGFEQLRDHVALYPGRMDRVTVDGELVRPQEGGFYGGWITDDVVGPFKGGLGTRGW